MLRTIGLVYGPIFRGIGGIPALLASIFVFRLQNKLSHYMALSKHEAFKSVQDHKISVWTNFQRDGGCQLCWYQFGHLCYLINSPPDGAIQTWYFYKMLSTLRLVCGTILRGIGGITALLASIFVFRIQNKLPHQVALSKHETFKKCSGP